MSRCLARLHYLILLLVLCTLPVARVLSEAGDGEGGPLATYSDASSEWGNGAEAVIENAFRECFRTYIISGKVVTLRMPFAQDEERSELTDTELTVTGSGKADPSSLWQLIDGVLATPEFGSYVATMEDGREKVITFDLQKRSWSASSDWYAADWMKAGVYLGLPHLINVLSRGKGITSPEIYNYLYSVARVGMDCAGFVWWVLKSVGRAGDVDLDATFRKYVGAPTADTAPLYVGSWFFDPRNYNLELVDDQVRNILPGDVIAFRGADGTIVHSAVIQSVDLAKGTIRYLQSTDEAPQDQRGVHDSSILFDPARPEVSLKDPALEWRQKNAPPFVGEADSGYRNDGERYRAHADLGGGALVRLKILKPIVEKLRGGSPVR